ncbi:multisubunit sodium/proton antiporter, MrpD subunit [Modicisalibacter ilicicola DSM 19980]|uniref:Multisubunit sodium/proton antiporter, MrpD subunit n=1 Tax=Modicisalibacter ilicicola DSM 19980 TaxID=1121942 RepID=A0A1M4ZQD0_9GAMM|nr:proton-conducting transporter membrane subunit [Halomonas ilicicola]SHF20249.1 multisubunit sodium/proton antiporter, MrpD subunit [Halomonas ilicicola DSM 19980]
MSELPGNPQLLVWLISLPLLGALMSVACRKAGRWTAMTAMIGNLVLACLLLAATQDGTLRYALGGWEAPLGIALYADTFSAMMIAITALVGAVISGYSLSYFATGSATERSFWPLWCLLLTALNTLFLSGDVFNLYVGLEVLSLSAVALVTLAPGLAATRAALRYLLASLMGSLCYLLGVALLYYAHATLDLALLADLTGDGPLERAALALMIVGLLLKTALFPLHFWLPPAHAGAPAPVSALLSALVLKGTFYLILRLWFDTLEEAANQLGTLLLGVLGCAAILWGSVQAIRATRLKQLVAYSTVAQIGYLFALFPLLGHATARVTAFDSMIYFIMAHACAKGAMFLAAGNILTVAGHDRIAELRAANLPSAITLFALAIAGISLIGLPPTGGFIAKWLMLQSAFHAGSWWLVVVVLLGGLLAAAYVFRVVAICFDRSEVSAPTDTAPRVATINPGREWSALVLALAALALGLLAAPALALFDATALMG